MKAKARRDRWHEEQTLILCEMDWTERFFHYMGKTWENIQSRPQNPPTENLDSRPLYREDTDGHGDDGGNRYRHDRDSPDAGDRDAGGGDAFGGDADGGDADFGDADFGDAGSGDADVRDAEDGDAKGRDSGFKGHAGRRAKRVAMDSNLYNRSQAAYAAKQSAMWKQMAARASAQFVATRLCNGIE